MRRSSIGAGVLSILALGPLGLGPLALGQEGSLPQVDLILDLGHTPPVAVIGEAFILSARMRNLGPEVSPSATLTLDLPPEIPTLALVEGSGSCAQKDRIVSCTLGEIGLSGERTLDLEGAATAIGTFEVGGRVSTIDAYDTALANNALTVEVPVVTDDDSARADLSLVIDEVGEAREAGDAFILHYITANAGPGPARGINLDGRFEGAFTLTSARDPQGDACDLDGGSFHCEVGDIAAGRDATCVIELLPTDTPPIQAYGEVFTPLAADPRYDDNRFGLSLDPLGGSGAADLSVGITPPADAAPLGGIARVGIRIQNVGPDTAGGATLSVTLPGSLSFVAGALGDAPCTPGDGQVTCTADALPRGEEIAGELSLRPSETGSIPLEGSVVGATGDPSEGNNSASATLVVTDQGPPPPEADVSLSLLATPDPAVAGRILTLTALAENGGPDESGPVFLALTLPDGIDAEAAETGCILEGGQLRCNLAALASGGSGSVSFTLTPPEAGSLAFTGEAFGVAVDPALLDNRAALTLTVAPPGSGGPEGSLVLTLEGPEGAPAGALFPVLGTLSAEGPGALPEVGAQTAAIGGAALALFGGLDPCIPPEGACALGSIPPGEGALYCVGRGDGEGSLSLSAELATGDAYGAAVTAEDAVSIPLTPEGPASDLTLSLDVPAAGSVGDALSLSVAISRAGGGADRAQLLLQPSRSAALIEVTGLGPGCAIRAGVLSCVDIPLDADGAASGQITLTPGRGGALLIGAAAWVEGEADPQPGDNVRLEALPIDGDAAGADLTLLARLLTPAPRALAPVYFTLDALNQGPGDAPEVTLALPLPEGASVGSDAQDALGCALADGALICDLGPLPWGAAAPMTLPLTFAEAGTYALPFALRAEGDDPHPEDNDTTLNVEIGEALGGDVDLALTLETALEVARVGQAIPLTARMTNRSEDAAPGITLSGALPPGTTLVAGSGCVAEGGVLTCTYDPLEAGAVATASLSLKAEAEGILALRLTLNSSARELSPVDNEGSLSLPVLPDDGVGYTDLSLGLALSAEVGSPGLPLIVTAAIENQGPALATGAVLTLPLPTGAQLESALGPEGACAIGPGEVRCALGDLPASALTTATLALTPAEAGTLRIEATVACDLHDTEPFDNRAAVDVVIEAGDGTTRLADLALAFDAAPEGGYVGDVLTWTLRAMNEGPDIAAGVRLSLTLPGAVTFLDVGGAQAPCAEDAGIVACDIGVLDAGASAALTVTGRGTSVGSQRARGAVTASTEDPDPENNAAEATVELAPAPRPGIAISGGGGDALRAVQGDGALPALAFTLTARDVEALTLSNLTLQATGTGDDARDLARVYVFEDTNGDGIPGAGEAILGEGRPGADDGRLVLSFDGGPTLAPGATIALGIAVDLAASVPPPTAGAAPLASPPTRRGDPPRGGPSAGQIPLAFGILLALGALLGAAQHSGALLGEGLPWGRWVCLTGAALALACAGFAEEGQVPPATFQLELTAFTAVGAESGEIAEVSGLPLIGVEIRVGGSL